MNFQSLKKVETASFYLDTALRRARERAASRRKLVSRKDPGRLKNLEIKQVEIFKNYLVRALLSIEESFPRITEMHPFYQELVKCSLDYVMLRQSLAAMNWARRRTCTLFKDYATKMRQSKDAEAIHRLKKACIGRTASVMKQIIPSLNYLEQARKVMKEFPVFKTSVKTVCIVGFPNAGKTTLLFRLTGSKPEIASYPFTTKGINVSYIREGEAKIQLLDTPGTLNREEKMNSIEKQAHLAMSMLADELVYIFDLTEEYPLEAQKKLYERIKSYGKKIIVYMSKTDILDREIVSAFAGKVKGAELVTSAEELKQKLLAQKI